MLAGTAQLLLGIADLLQQGVAVVLELVVVSGQGGADVVDQPGAGLLVLGEAGAPLFGGVFGGVAEALGEGAELLFGDGVELFVGALNLLAEAGQ